MNFPADLTFPGLPERYLSALQEAAAFILQRYEPIGILACGTIIRGNPSPSSDFDLYVVHAAGWRQRVQKYFRGVPAEIFVNPLQQIEKYLVEEQAEARPITAHMLATGFVILERSPQVTRLRKLSRELLARAPEMGAQEQVFSRYMAACLYEDALDVATSQPEAASLIMHRAVYAMLHFAFRRAGRFLPRDKDLLAELDGLDTALGQLARAYFRAAALPDRLRAAEDIADRTIQAHGFFEWEGEAENV